MTIPRLVDKPLVLYGYGKLGRLAEEIFGELGIPVLIWDKKLPCPVARYPEDFLLAVCVASEPYQPIHASLKVAGWTDIVPVWDIIEAYPEIGIRNGWFAGTLDQKDQAGIGDVVSHLGDGWSWYHYVTFGHWRISHYEDKFWKWCPIGPRISLPSTLADIRERQHKQKYMIEVQGDVILHNEGYELQTIQDSIAVFQKGRPRLQVACYHSRDGLWKIPKFLMDNLERYRFYFRLHAYMGQGAYIYCIPEERKENELWMK